MSLDELEYQALDRIDRAIASDKRIKKVWALYSGGYDSFAAARVASRHPLFGGAIHVNRDARLEGCY